MNNGIYKQGSKFYYYTNNKLVTESSIIERLKQYRVPPAWTAVWYSANPKSHVQVHGVDQGGKKQYILSQDWITRSTNKKYSRLRCFIKDLVAFRRKIRLKQPFEINYSNVICLVFNLLLATHIRVGNEKYVPHSYGLTTFRQRHFVNDQFIFIGKSGIQHTVDVPGVYIPFLRSLKTTGGKNDVLFWYQRGKAITSSDLNDYLKQHMGKQYTCKDFRTYSANILFIKAFLKNTKILPARQCIVKSIIYSAEHLGHSKNICRKSYISDTLIRYCTDSFDTACGESVESLLSRV